MPSRRPSACRQVSEAAAGLPSIFCSIQNTLGASNSKASICISPGRRFPRDRVRGDSPLRDGGESKADNQTSPCPISADLDTSTGSSLTATPGRAAEIISPWRSRKAIRWSRPNDRPPDGMVVSSGRARLLHRAGLSEKGLDGAELLVRWVVDQAATAAPRFRRWWPSC